MKVAISSIEKSLDGKVSDTFGRCPYFLIVEIEDKKVKGFDVVENTSAKQASGAGISAAQLVVENSVEAVISENVGPKAKEVFEKCDIKIYCTSGLIKEVLEKFIDDEFGKNEKGEDVE